MSDVTIRCRSRATTTGRPCRNGLNCPYHDPPSRAERVEELARETEQLRTDVDAVREVLEDIVGVTESTTDRLGDLSDRLEQVGGVGDASNDERENDLRYYQ